MRPRGSKWGMPPNIFQTAQGRPKRTAKSGHRVTGVAWFASVC